MSDWTVTATAVRPLLGSVTRPITTAEAMSLGQVGYINGSGTLNIADGSAASTAAGQLAIVVAGAAGNTSGSVASGEVATVLLMGPVAGFTSLDETKQYFLSDTSGKGADAAGTVTRALGWPLSSTVFNFVPGDNRTS